jgi:hypothetical protein
VELLSYFRAYIRATNRLKDFEVAYVSQYLLIFILECKESVENTDSHQK